jgi:membrane-bound lytic murein transglycosylase D
MRLKKTVVILIFTCVAGLLKADTLRLRTDDPILAMIDSLQKVKYLSSEKFTVSKTNNKYNMPADSVPRPDVALITQRLKKLDAASPMNLAYNEHVQAYIDLYCLKGRSVTSKILGLSEVYFPLFEQYLDKYGIPLELKYLPIIESALNPRAKSPAGATGLWQFMYPTGKLYGLEVSSYTDDRCDPIKSTEAACKYLKFLYSLYKDWNLALAAYNAGPGTINNAIRRSGGKTNYWDIFPYIPRETRGYVPAFIAAAYFMNYYQEHNLIPFDTKKQYFEFDTVHINRNISMHAISKVLNIQIEDLMYMNPVFKTAIIPGEQQKWHFYLPVSKVGDFINNADSIYRYNDNAASKTEPEKKYTKVRSGETLSRVASRLGVQVSELQAWNNINGTYVKAGRWLVYYDPGTAPPMPEKTNTTQTEKPKTTQQSTHKQYTIYTVRSGDTLDGIAKRKGKSSNAIKLLNPNVKWNNLQIGQKIRIPG